MSSRDSISVVADQIGTPTSAKTLAQALWLFVDRPELTGVYHFTDNGVASWYDFAVAIMEESVSLGLLSNEIEINRKFVLCYKRNIHILYFIITFINDLL